jgi:hypothetical protein
MVEENRDNRRSNNVSNTRRGFFGSIAVVLTGLTSQFVLAQKPAGSNNTDHVRSSGSSTFQERMNSAGIDERMQLIYKYRQQREQEFIESLRKDLDIPEPEWVLVQPRLEAVYNLKHPTVPMGRTSGQAATEEQRIRNELRECLDDKQSPTDRIKASLQAYRIAKEKTRQELTAAQGKLREVLILRQEALLVLRGLLE